MFFINKGSRIFQGIRRILRPFSIGGNSTDMKLVWIDMEMTGLEIQRDYVLEVACMLTDPNLTEIVQGPHVIIRQSDRTLQSMGPWCIEQHTKTGLVEECKRSKITESDAEKILMEFLMKHLRPKEGVLAGNNVYMDRMFLQKYFPKVNDFLHYRIVDVSSVKELCREWFPVEYCNAPEKSYTHRALVDIKQSIEELQYYKNTIFKPS